MSHQRSILFIDKQSLDHLCDLPHSGGELALLDGEMMNALAGDAEILSRVGDGVFFPHAALYSISSSSGGKFFSRIRRQFPLFDQFTLTWQQRATPSEMMGRVREGIPPRNEHPSHVRGAGLKLSQGGAPLAASMPALSREASGRL
jgi:hypothetical protein